MGDGREYVAGRPEVGTVVQLKGQRMIVRLDARPQCSCCGARYVCTTVNDKVRELTLPNQVDAQVGDAVEIAVRPRVRMLSVVLVFGLPVTLAMLGYLVGWQIFQAEKPAVFATMGGVVLALVLAWAVNQLVENRHESPVHVRRIAPKSSVTIANSVHLKDEQYGGTEENH